MRRNEETRANGTGSATAGLARGSCLGEFEDYSSQQAGGGEPIATDAQHAISPSARAMSLGPGVAVPSVPTLRQSSARAPELGSTNSMQNPVVRPSMTFGRLDTTSAFRAGRAERGSSVAAGVAVPVEVAETTGLGGGSCGRSGALPQPAAADRTPTARTAVRK